MDCKYHRIRTKRNIKYGYCILHKKEVSLFSCKCEDVDYKEYKPIKKRSNKLGEAEKNRFSIIYQDLTKCCECGLKDGDYDVRLGKYTYISVNEVFGGAYRPASIKNGMCCPFCEYCHFRFHSNREFSLKYKIMFENKFIELYDYNTYMKIFNIDYNYR